MPASLDPITNAAVTYGNDRAAEQKAQDDVALAAVWADLTETQAELDEARTDLANLWLDHNALAAEFAQYKIDHPADEDPDPDPDPVGKPAPIDKLVWWTHQSNSIADIVSQTTRLAGHQRASNGVIGGVSIRMPWDAVETDSKLTSALEATKKLADSLGLPMAFRLMAGKHTPAAILDKSRTYNDGGQRVPIPWDNPGFETEYEKTHRLIFKWMTDNLPTGAIKLCHFTWYGREWAEVNMGKEVRAVAGYSQTVATEGHKRLVTIAHTIQQDYPTVAVEFPGSGYGDVFDLTNRVAEHAATLWGKSTDSFYMQANGWGQKPSRWGQPQESLEQRLDPALATVGSYGLQAIQPWREGGTGAMAHYDAAAWRAALSEARGSRYLEVYDPSFDAVAGTELAAYIA